MTESTRARPFLKWAGGKAKKNIIERIRAKLPPGRRLIEPFAGSGAVFLNTSFEAYWLNDNNPDLINLYQILQTSGKAFIDYCREFFQPETNEAERFYDYRDTFNQTRDESLKAALFLYLNRHGYNGLCRYNRKGQFNVPFGQFSRVLFPEKAMAMFYEKSQRAVFSTHDYAECLNKAETGDIIYCDPPYVPLTLTAKFTQYTSKSFLRTDQETLATLAQETALRGIPVLISNHATPTTLALYQRAEITQFSVPRFISRNTAKRVPAEELLALYTRDCEKSV